MFCLFTAKINKRVGEKKPVPAALVTILSDPIETAVRELEELGERLEESGNATATQVNRINFYMIYTIDYLV